MVRRNFSRVRARIVDYTQTPAMTGMCRLLIVTLLFLFTSHCTSPAQDKATQRTQIVLLGTGTPLPDPERSGPCAAVVVNGTPYLVDLGTGVVRRAAAARNKGVTALEPTDLIRTNVFSLV
jgi:hypothetical protein